MSRIVQRYLKKIAQSTFPRNQISYKDKFRITEEIDMQRASEKIVDAFIESNGNKIPDYHFIFEEAEPTLFDDDYTWFEGNAQGYIKGPENNYPVKVNLTQGDIWTVTLYERF